MQPSPVYRGTGGQPPSPPKTALSQKALGVNGNGRGNILQLLSEALLYPRILWAIQRAAKPIASLLTATLPEPEEVPHARQRYANGSPVPLGAS